MESSRRESHGILFGILLLLLTGLFAGCGARETVVPDPFAQDSTGDSTVVYTRENPPPFLTAARSPGLLAPAALGLPDLRPWYALVTRWVVAGTETVVDGGRYELRFQAASLANDGAQVVIKEWSPNVLEFELGPDGSTFGAPVDLYVDFTATNADSSSLNFDGSVPELYWFNEERGTWDVVPGTVEGKKFHAKLEHFSTYGLARGKGGW